MAGRQCRGAVTRLGMLCLRYAFLFILLQTTVAKVNAVVYDTYDPDKALANKAVPVPKEPSSPPGAAAYLVAGLVVVWAGLIIRRRVMPAKSDAPELPPLLQNNPAFREFFDTLNSEEMVIPHPQQKANEATSTTPKPEAVPEFFLQAPKILPRLRTRLAEVSRSSDDTARLRLLHQFRTEFLECHADSDGATSMQPVWDLGSTLDGLLIQLLNKSTNITHTVLRSIGEALDLLDILCSTAIAEKLALAEPPRVLLVDDDAISRKAVSFDLERVLPSPPDVAENGEVALELAATQGYDVIFLDIEMPGMDGYEICTRIRELAWNTTTPVVFVTKHNDFDSRAKSFLSGGRDLISKPYLTFEIALKALTLVFRARLTSIRQSLPLPAPSNAGSSSPDSSPAAAVPSAAVPAVPSASSPASEMSPAALAATLLTPIQDEFAAAFFAGTLANLPTIRAQLKSLAAAGEETARQEVLSNLYLGVRALTADAEQAELRSLVRFCSVLQALFRKLLESPETLAPHVLEAAESAFDVLESLSTERLNPNLHAPPLNILVVDDVAVCRSAYANALQLAFQKPQLANSGAAAIALAGETAFDAIFMDVGMPDMDGFTACLKIHEIPLNAQAPVVFVTTLDDLKSRKQAKESGGCGFIPKPAMAVEITLTALTLAIQRRLAAHRAASVQDQAAK